jgi:hypothetical protein
MKQKKKKKAECRCTAYIAEVLQLLGLAKHEMRVRSQGVVYAPDAVSEFRLEVPLERVVQLLLDDLYAFLRGIKE